MEVHLKKLHLFLLIKLNKHEIIKSSNQRQNPENANPTKMLFTPSLNPL